MRRAVCTRLGLFFIFELGAGAQPLRSMHLYSFVTGKTLAPRLCWHWRGFDCSRAHGRVHTRFPATSVETEGCGLATQTPRAPLSPRPPSSGARVAEAPTAFCRFASRARDVGAGPRAPPLPSAHAPRGRDPARLALAASLSEGTFQGSGAYGQRGRVTAQAPPPPAALGRDAPPPLPPRDQTWLPDSSRAMRAAFTGGRYVVDPAPFWGGSLLAPRLVVPSEG